MIEAARAACRALAAHGIAIAEDALAAELARRSEAAGGAALQVEDLALAWACVQRDERAIAHLEQLHFARARRALAKLRINPTIVDDVLDWLRFELFVRPGPLIADYSGRGAIGSWLRAIAVHEALKRTRRARREVPAEHAPELPVPEPELVAMRGAYGAEFTRALADSFASLSTGERNLLRQYFLDGLTIDVLAQLYKIHRATAARRVAAARARLVEQVRSTLARELALSDAGVDQVITLSNLDESLGQLLRATR